jgi:tetratricopeptide (TPR) repeat protein
VSRIAYYMGKTKYLREIETEYHILELAQDARELKNYQYDLLHQQIEHDQARQDQGQQALQQARAIHEALERISGGLDAIIEVSAEQLEVARETNQTLRAINLHIQRAANLLADQQRTLERIEHLLANPYEAKALELRREASKWLTHGARRPPGRERDADWDDATKLFDATTENAIGNQDYVVWFKKGWLAWKHAKDLPRAEASFFRAQRLSSFAGDAYHVLSLRHMAHMQYEQDNHEGAWETIQRALTLDQAYNTLYDGSRYAASLGKRDEAYELLSRAIDAHAPLFLTMETEPDFR